MDFPNLNQIAYLGCILHKYSQDELISAAHQFMFEASGTDMPSTGWSGKAHHMAVKFKPQLSYLQKLSPLMGKEINLGVEYWIADEYCLTAIVKPQIDLPIPGVPHITVAHSHEVNSTYSNVLLTEKHRWQPEHKDLQLTSYLLAVENGNKPFWPYLGNIPLARTSVMI